jgi:hypothetical protein
MRLEESLLTIVPSARVAAAAPPNRNGQLNFAHEILAGKPRKTMDTELFTTAILAVEASNV